MRVKKKKKKKDAHLPFLKSIPQQGMLTPQHDDQIRPPLRKNVARMPIEDESTL